MIYVKYWKLYYLYLYLLFNYKKYKHCYSNNKIIK